LGENVTKLQGGLTLTVHNVLSLQQFRCGYQSQQLVADSQRQLHSVFTALFVPNENIWSGEFVCVCCILQRNISERWRVSCSSTRLHSSETFFRLSFTR